jgi:Phage terminase large subunit
MRVAWAPQHGPQHALVTSPAAEIFFGGSRGGGKTDGVLGKWLLKDYRFGKQFNAVMFRRTTVSSVDAIDRSKQIFGPLGGKFNESKLTWRMPNGGRVAFGYLDSVDDAAEYQGRNLTDAWIEEAGQYPSPDPIFRLFGALRSSGGVPVQMILTGNPGGPGQSWIRDRYEMVPFPTRPRLLIKPLPDGTTHHVMVIPSRLTDNKILMRTDPSYASRLQLVGKAQLVRAWLDGDWNAIEGAFFDEWDEKRHVIPAFVPPASWMRFRSMDWGSASPFSVAWWAVASDDHSLADGRVIPRGALVRYREWYGSTPDNLAIGLKLTNEQMAEGILDREKDEKIAYGVLDPSAFNEGGGPSYYEQMRRIRGYNGPLFRKADNTRIPKHGSPGWMAIRERLRGDAEGRPMMFVSEDCKALIRTLPMLQHDPDRPEDLDTTQIDHAADECRYACLSRPWTPSLKKPAADKDPSGYSAVKKTSERVSIATL